MQPAKPPVNLVSTIIPPVGAVRAFAYTTDVTTPDGSRGASIRIKIAHLATDALRFTIEAPGKEPASFEVNLGAGDESDAAAPAAPASTDQNIVKLLLARIKLAAQLLAAKGTADAAFPMLPPGAGAPVNERTTFHENHSRNAIMWSGEAHLSTSATVQKNVAMKPAITPIGMITHRVKASEESKPHTFPDDMTSLLRINVVSGKLIQIDGTTTNVLHTSQGDKTIREQWALLPIPVAP